MMPPQGATSVGGSSVSILSMGWRVHEFHNAVQSRFMNFTACCVLDLFLSYALVLRLEPVCHYSYLITSHI